MVSFNTAFLDEISFARRALRGLLERLATESPKFIADSDMESLDKFQLLISELQLLGVLLDRQTTAVLADMAAKRGAD